MHGNFSSINNRINLNTKIKKCLYLQIIIFLVFNELRFKEEKIFYVLILK